MNNIFKYLLIGGGLAYFFMGDQIKAALHISGQPGAPLPNEAQPVTPTPAATAPAVATEATDTKSRMLAAASTDAQFIANGGRLSAFQWGFYYELKRGTKAKDPAALGIADPAMLLSIDEYWTAATRGGMAGIRRRAAARAWGMQ